MSPLPSDIDSADCDPWQCHYGEDDGQTPVVLWICDHHAHIRVMVDELRSRRWTVTPPRTSDLRRT